MSITFIHMILFNMNLNIRVQSKCEQCEGYSIATS